MSDLIHELRQGAINNDDYRWRAADEITTLRAEVERLKRIAIVQEKLLRARDAENERRRAALNILQAAMTAKKPIPMAFKKAILEARAALSASQPAPSQLGDAVNYGIGITLDGKRIDPQDFYLPPAPQKEGE